MATATKERIEVVFLSRSRNYRIVLKPRRNRLVLDSSQQVVAQPEVAVEDLPVQPFIRSYNEQAAANGDPEIDGERLPSAIDFKNWTFETDDSDIILALRNHPEFGKELAFTEKYPTAEERLGGVAKLTAQGDVDGLKALLELERAQGNHASVLDAGETALEALDTEAEPEGNAEGETAEAGSTNDSTEPRDGPPDSKD